MIIKVLSDLRRKMDENSEDFHKELENIKKNQAAEEYTFITKINIIVEWINSWFDNTEE